MKNNIITMNNNLDIDTTGIAPNIVECLKELKHMRVQYEMINKKSIARNSLIIKIWVAKAEVLRLEKLLFDNEEKFDDDDEEKIVAKKRKINWNDEVCIYHNVE